MCSHHHNITDALTCNFNKTLKSVFAMFCCFSSQLVVFPSISSPIDFTEQKKGGLFWSYLKCRETLQTNVMASAIEMLYLNRKHAPGFGGMQVLFGFHY